MKNKTKNPYFNKERHNAWEIGYQEKSPNKEMSPDTEKAYLEGQKIGLKDRSVIPEGMYCYVPVSVTNGVIKIKKCPYWDLKHNNKLKGKVGKCGFLQLTDDEIGNQAGLLFDYCKECGINEKWEDEEIS